MFERLNTPAEAFHFQLGATPEMARTVLENLESGDEEAQDERAKALDHVQESEQRVTAIEDSFWALSVEIDGLPCPAINGLKADRAANAKKADDSIVDSVLLQGAVKVKRHKIGVHQNRILNAKAPVIRLADLLTPTLDDEQATLEKVLGLRKQVAAVTPKDSVQGPGGIVGKMKEAVS